MRLRNYDKEFKLNAISLCSDGKNISKVSKDLGIPASTLNGWVKQHKKEKDKSFPGSGNIKSSNVELYNLKKELEDVKMQRDILKKALAIFSKHQI